MKSGDSQTAWSKEQMENFRSAEAHVNDLERNDREAKAHTSFGPRQNQDPQRDPKNMTLCLGPAKTRPFKEERNATMSAGKIVLGAVIAIAAGAALGVLFAPDKGSATRKKISKEGSRYMGTLKDTASGYVDAIEEKIESVQETAVGLTDKVKDAVDSLAGNEPQKHTRRT